ncbi:MAG: hypothetical protein CMD68_04680 [Gammaproteobacteria bacterium]|nr:hypothetical protein [Gammaproteobacteria bacterium]|tara:strand:- start:320 stop:565 length:246 start_codon:yes stop_codon:yes gene_type:complete
MNRDINKTKWKCRRGLRELDLLFRKYSENNLELLSPDDLKMFNSILDIEDQRLYDFIFKNISLDDASKENFILKNIKKFTS